MKYPSILEELEVIHPDSDPSGQAKDVPVKAMAKVSKYFVAVGTQEMMQLLETFHNCKVFRSNYLSTL